MRERVEVRTVRRWRSFAALPLLLAFLLPAPLSAGTVVVKPGRLDHFVLTAPPGAVAGESFVVRVEPYDANRNIITNPEGRTGSFLVGVTGAAEAEPAKLRFTDIAGGASVRVTDRRAEEIEITITESGAATPLAAVRLQVMPNKLDRFALNVPKSVVAGEPFQCRIIGQDAFGNTKVDLPSTASAVRIAVQGTGSAQLLDKQVPPFRSGETIVSFEPRKVGRLKILVEEGKTYSRGEGAEFQVLPGPLDHFVVLGPKAAMAGQKFTLLLSAYDRFENLVTNYATSGDGVILSSGGGPLAPAAVEAKSFRDGQAKVEVTYNRAENLRVTAQERNRDISGRTEAIAITPAAPDHFEVATPAEAVSGEAFTVQVQALDRFNNLIEDYDLRGFEVYLSADGSGMLSPSTVSPSAFSKGKASLKVTYDKAESFSVVAALSKEDLERIIKERARRAPVPAEPAPTTPDEMAREKERDEALRAREEARQAREEIDERRAREEAEKAREEAREAIDRAPPRPIEATPLPPPVSPEGGEPFQVARRTVYDLQEISLVETKDQVMVVLETSGPVSYNATTGSALSKEWIYVELFPAARLPDGVGDLIKVDSELVGDIQVEDLEDERVKVSLEVLPKAISYVVSQQDRSIVVKIIKSP